MKFVAISDTHGKYRQLELPDGDCLIHAGDVSNLGERHEILDFLDWFENLDFKYKVFIAGNHDFYFDGISQETVDKIIPKSIIYLNDSTVEIEGIKIHGSPIQPWFFDWAFNRQRGEDIDKHWQLIPLDTDILITHGPAYGILDKTLRGEKVGCEDLKQRIKKVRPAYHICGHIHEARGLVQKNETYFINASVVDIRNQLVHEAFEFEYEAQHPLFEILGNPNQFLTSLFSQLGELKIDVQQYEMDHICYRVETEDKYVSVKNELLNFGKLLTEKEIGGRSISIIKLDKPILFHDKKKKKRKIFLIELPAPKSGSFYREGFEHVEFAIGEDPKNFISKYPDINFDIKGINKKINADLRLKLGNCSVKFHEYSLEYVVAHLEK